MGHPFNAIDLSQLPAPQLIETVDYEAILAARKSYIIAAWNEFRQSRPDLPALDTLDLETEPIVIGQQSSSYRETLLRALVNDKARAVLLAFSAGSDLDHLAVRFSTDRVPIVRMPAVAEPRPFATNPEDWESDERFRRRLPLALKALSCGGPRGAYEFWALTHAIEVADAHAYKDPGAVIQVAVAGTDGADVSDEVVAGLVTLYQDEHVVPLTDEIVVRRAVRRDYAVSGTVFCRRGPDPALLLAQSEAKIRAYASARARIGATVYRSGLVAAGAIDAAEDFTLSAPGADVDCADDEIPHLTGVELQAVVL